MLDNSKPDTKTDQSKLYTKEIIGVIQKRADLTTEFSYCTFHKRPYIAIQDFWDGHPKKDKQITFYPEEEVIDDIIAILIKVKAKIAKENDKKLFRPKVNIPIGDANGSPDGELQRPNDI